MTIHEPIFGIDLSYNNDGVSVAEAARQNYEFGILRVTGGFNAQRGVLVDWKYPDFHRQQRQTNQIQGVYGFPLNPNYIDLDVQVDRFLNNIIGGVEGKIIAVDYERYGPMPEASCTIAGLKGYINRIRNQTGGHKILLYAGKTWWEEAPHSGLLSDYGEGLELWNPWYYSMNTVQKPKEHYFRWYDDRDNGWWEQYAGTRPMMAQYCIGKVDGQSVDINAWRGTYANLLDLTS